MTGRILRIELRRTAAFWAAAVSLPLTSLAAGVAGQGITDARSELGLLAPLAMGIGAWQASRDRRSRTSELLATTARPPWQRRLHTATALGIGAVTGSLVVLAGLAAYAAAVGSYVPVAVLVSALMTALCLAAAVWLGLAVGRAAPWVPVPPLVVIAGLVAMVWLGLLTDTEGYVGRTPPGTLLLNPISSTGFEAFETLTARALLAQASWVGAIAAACLLLCVATGGFRLSALLPLALGLVTALTLLPSSLHDAITLDRGALALVCTPDEPRVCARRLHPRVLDDLREPGRRALEILSAKLPQAPTTVAEAYYGNDSPVRLEPRADTVYAEVITDGTGRVDATQRDILWTLLMGAGTPACPNASFGSLAEIARYNAARVVAAAWLLEQQPHPPSDPNDPALPDATVTGAAYETLLALPGGEQRARVTALREAELACDGQDRLDILVGDADTL
jgi:hypothetical protein